MKKLILLLIIIFGISSCSDDNTNSTIITPLEGDWLLVYQYGGDSPPGEEPPGDISDQNIRYHFNGNIQKTTKNGEPIFETDYFLSHKKTKIIYLIVKLMNQECSMITKHI